MMLPPLPPPRRHRHRHEATHKRPLEGALRVFRLHFEGLPNLLHFRGTPDFVRFVHVLELALWKRWPHASSEHIHGEGEIGEVEERLHLLIHSATLHRRQVDKLAVVAADVSQDAVHRTHRQTARANA